MEKEADGRMTAVERIRSSIAEEIVRGDYAPGVSLDESTLAERFGVSRTPVREALRQLEAIGFAEARPRRGSVVRHFTPQKLSEMFAVMAEMEVICARFAAENASAERVELLKRAHARCRRAAEEGMIDDYAAANFAFHEAIYALSGNEFLVETTMGVRNRVAPFRKAQFRSFGRLLGSVEEHSRIVEAILQNDPDRAAREMRAHVRVVRDAVGAVAPALSASRDQPAARLSR